MANQQNNNNPFHIAQQQIRACADILGLDAGTREVLLRPMREFHVNFPVRMDDGTTKLFEGYRVQYNDAKGPTKGGIRFHPDETIDTVRALAAWMTWKCSLLDLPLGGGKGGVVCNPKELSAPELERVSRAYIKAVGQFISPTKDIPAPDVYTNPQIMAWMVDEYSGIVGNNQFGVITGKPLALGGSPGRADATARGGMFTLREAAWEIGLDLSKATMAIQGYGNAGCYAASLAESMFGCKIVAVCDSKGAVGCKDGICVPKLTEHKQATKSVCNCEGTKDVSSQSLMEMDVDVLVLAALEGVLTERNADKVKAKMVVELANGPTTPEADEILFRKGIHVIPDFLCNAGGVTVSYFEMVQNAYMYYWDEKEVREKLDVKMTRAYHEVLETSKKFKINMRKAAYVVAVERVVEAMKLRGWV
ncbi:MAG: Glu/Leu/Phe/Val dehydrogenase [Syntrophales bacterium]|nr:Glu/Leu/Phe/Val dehydrogenase [Syntrophales bacterium]MDD5640369.1 Glu/Leu/Phe/Val dehydrogenase [Syntrophales bacterium]